MKRSKSGIPAAGALAVLFLAPAGCAEPTVPGSRTAWASVAAGDGSTCAIDADGSAYCWGRNHLGQLGAGTAPDSSGRPMKVQGGPTFSQVSAAGSNVCAVSAAGDAYCWGSWSGYSEVVATPRAVAVGRKFQVVHAGGTYGQACGLETAGSAYCWAVWQAGGWQESSQSGPFREVVASAPCGLTSGGQIACWPQRVAGAPQPLSGASGPFVGLASGARSVCAWTADGEAYCTRTYTVGVGGSATVNDLAPVPRGIRFTQVSVGGSGACGVAGDGRAYCWELAISPAGSGSTTPHGTPHAVGGGLRFEQVSVGGDHACGVTTDGEIHCWGSNQWGQLGTGVIGGAATAPEKVREP
jgi:alpha-tubulin suppressor-like RCC1 family protein